MKTYRLRTKDELRNVARAVLAVARGSGRADASVVALHGDLGAGKTAFTQQLAAELGVAEPVTSPTFVVMKSYATSDPEFPQLTHIDAYRIEDPSELAVLHFDELLRAPGLVSIEWAERIQTWLPPHALHVSFAIDGEERIITLQTNG